MKRISSILALAALSLPAALPADALSVYLERSSSPWGSNTYIYSWNSVGKPGGAWPGERMSFTNIGVTIDGVEYWKYDFDDSAFDETHQTISVIFCGGSSSSQTVNIENIGETTFYAIGSKGSDGKYKVNVLDNPLVVGLPEISSARNVVTITPTSSDCEIRYTLDGSDPTVDSDLYTGPFELTEDTLVRCIQIKGELVSEVAQYQFTWHYYAPVGAAALYLSLPEGSPAPEAWNVASPWIPVEGGEFVADQPETLYLLGTIPDHKWDTSYAVPFTRYGACYVLENIELNASSESNPDSYFSFATTLDEAGATAWSGVNKGDRFGGATNNEELTVETTAPYTWYKKGVNASECHSWKVSPGTYTIVVDFANGTILLTQSQLADGWTPMIPLTKVNDGVDVEGMDLYRLEAPATSEAAFRYGEETLRGGQLIEGVSYICNNGEWGVYENVGATLLGHLNRTHTGESYLIFSEGTVAASASYEGNTFTYDSERGDLDFSSIQPNALVNVEWKATNAMGVNFYGNEQLINLPVGSPAVKIYATVPTGWEAISYSISSNLDGTLSENGIFSEWEGAYLVLEVPSHLIHSTVVLSNSANSAVREAESSYTLQLAGESMYFENDGEHWANVPAVSVGVESNRVTETEEVYYNLQGIVITDPVKGLYIRKSGNRIEKVLL